MERTGSSQEAEYVCLRRYPPAPNRAVNDLPCEKGFRYVHLPMERVKKHCVSHPNVNHIDVARYKLALGWLSRRAASSVTTPIKDVLSKWICRKAKKSIGHVTTMPKSRRNRKAPAPKERRGGIDRSLYTLNGYTSWTEWVKRNWSEE